MSPKIDIAHLISTTPSNNPLAISDWLKAALPGSTSVPPLGLIKHDSVSAAFHQLLFCVVKKTFELSFYWAREINREAFRHGYIQKLYQFSQEGKRKKIKRFRKASEKCYIVTPFTNKGIFQLRDFPIHEDKLNSGYDCRTLESQEAACQEQGCWLITSMHVKLHLTFHVKLAGLRANHNSTRPKPVT